MRASHPDANRVKRVRAALRLRDLNLAHDAANAPERYSPARVADRIVRASRPWVVRRPTRGRTWDPADVVARWRTLDEVVFNHLDGDEPAVDPDRWRKYRADAVARVLVALRRVHESVHCLAMRTGLSCELIRVALDELERDGRAEAVPIGRYTYWRRA